MTQQKNGYNAVDIADQRVAQFSAGYTTNMCGFDLRRGQAPPNHLFFGKLSPKRWNGISVTEQTAVAWPLRF
jgi:hypothetical protein